MTQVSGTTTSYKVGSGGGNREDLGDKLWDLFADESWALSNLDKTTATGVNHEIMLDTLAAAGANAQLEGDDASYTTLVNPVRVGNYCQIFRKTFMVSGTQEVVSKAGRSKEATRQSMKKMRELKNDIEYALVRNQGSTAGLYASARLLGSMESWITQQTKATTTAAAASAGWQTSIVTAPVDGSTTGPLGETELKTALQSAWAAGGNVTTILVGPTQKNRIDTFSGIATRFIEANPRQQTAIMGAANLYKSSYGTHNIVLHRHVRSSVVLCLDPEYWAVSYLRRPFMEKLAKTGDAEKYQMVAELTLESRNANASSKVVACS
jgi:hypothetical protein